MKRDRRCDGPNGYPFDDDPPPRREKPGGVFRDATFAETTAAARIRREAKAAAGGSSFRDRKRRRNLVILLCHEVGLSNRAIADVFGLARSQVATVLETIEARLDTGPEGDED